MLSRVFTAMLVRPVCGVAARGGGSVSSSRDAAAGSVQPPSGGVMHELSMAVEAGRAVVKNFMDIVSLEVRQAGLAVVWMVACGIMSAILLAVGWIGIMAACAMWGIASGLPPLLVVALLALVNFVVAGGLILRAAAMSHELSFPASRRQLTGDAHESKTTP